MLYIASRNMTPPEPPPATRDIIPLCHRRTSMRWGSLEGGLGRFAAPAIFACALLILISAAEPGQLARHLGKKRGVAMAAAGAGSEHVACYVTVPNRETGVKIASGLVEGKLAACVNMIPGVESMYFWEGKVETDSELLLMIKTRRELVPELTSHVVANHPYDLAEVIAVPIEGGNEPYMKWITDSTKSSRG
mmetsp:Transcript_29747/g.95668  ORF Transcript_29747/g.95668 Transcript_29747/m.95668 type:complete len:192 (-) Transcript_29747:811-1386(-)